MKPIRREISEIVRVLIPEDKWNQTFKELEKEGRLSQRQIIQILLVVLKRLEALENEPK